MGIDRSNIPDEYMCERCQPRHVDRQHARTLQLRKREELLNTDSSSDTSSSTDTDGGKCITFYWNLQLCNLVRWFEVTFRSWNEHKELKNRGKNAVWKWLHAVTQQKLENQCLILKLLPVNRLYLGIHTSPLRSQQ